MRRILADTHASLLEGHRLSEAMARQGQAFPPLYRAMVAAGESSGSLPAILERLADLLERDQQVRGKVITALVYPAMLAATALVVVDRADDLRGAQGGRPVRLAWARPCRC